MQKEKKYRKLRLKVVHYLQSSQGKNNLAGYNYSDWSVYCIYD